MKIHKLQTRLYILSLEIELYEWILHMDIEKQITFSKIVCSYFCWVEALKHTQGQTVGFDPAQADSEKGLALTALSYVSIRMRGWTLWGFEQTEVLLSHKK